MLRSHLVRAVKAGVLWALAFLFSLSCMRDRVNGDAKPDEIRNELARLFPPGSRVTDARDFLTRDGFTCSEEKGEFAGTSRRGLFIYCDRSRGVLISRRIQIALFHEEGKIIETAATAGLIGP